MRMDYKIGGRIFEADEAEVKANMKEFEISREDAVRMYFEDIEIIEAGKGTKITPIEEGKPAKRHYIKSDKPRKQSNKVRKVDTEKKVFIDKLVSMLAETDVTDVVVKNEVDVTFKSGETLYTFKLTKHRPPKA